MYKKLLVAVVLLSLLTTLFPLGAASEAPLGARAAEIAREEVGSPFVRGGETPRGFDASGLVYYVFGQLGVEVPRTVAEQHLFGEGVRRSDLSPGDIVLFAHEETRFTGIFVGGTTVVWASRSLGRVRTANLNEAAISRMFRGARRITRSSETSIADLVIATAEQYLGVPYLFGAEGPTRFDCSGFTQWVFAAHGITLPRTSRSQALVGRAVSRNDLAKGDLLIFVDTWREGISHVGIYIGEGRFIHTVPRSGVSYANLGQSYWSTRLHSVRRVLP